MSDEETQVIEVDLTEKQKEVADWLLGCPSMEEWFDEDHDSGFDFSHLNDPEIEDGVLELEISGHLLDNIKDELKRYSQMAYNSLEGRKAAGEARAAKNLVEKIEENSGEEIVDRCEEIRRERVSSIRGEE